MTSHKLLCELVRNYRNKGTTVVLMVVLTGLGLVAPLLHGAVLDALHMGKTLCFVLVVVSVAVALELVSLGVGFWLEAVRVRSSAQLVADIRRRVWEHLSVIPMQAIYAKPPGEWMQRLNGDTEIVCGAFQSIVVEFLNIGLFCIGTGALIFAKSPPMLLFFAAVVAVGILTHRQHEARIVRRAHHLRDGLYAFSSCTFDLLLMHPLLRMFGLREVFLRKFDRQNNIMAKRQVSARWAPMRYSITLGVEMALVHGAILAVCITMYSCGRIGFGDIWVYEMLISQITAGANRILEMLPQIDQGCESGKALAEFFAIKGEGTASVTKSDCECRKQDFDVSVACGYNRHNCGLECKSAITFRHVSFAYEHSNSLVLQDCSLTIKAGEMVCVIGRNGAGKSTFINLVLGTLKPTNGEITVNVRSQAIVPQRVNIFAGSVLENIRLYDDSMPEEDVLRIADECGLAQWLSTLQNGLRTKIAPETVSGGELQRLAIARAMVRSPDLLVVDEITNNLDIVEKRRIRKILQKLKKGRTILAVTHDIDMAEDADRCFAFTGGTVREVSPLAGESIVVAAIREIDG